MKRSLVVIASCIASTSVTAQVAPNSTAPGSVPPPSQVPPLQPWYAQPLKPEDIKPDPCDTQACYRAADPPPPTPPGPNMAKVGTNAVGNATDAENALKPFLKPGLTLPDGVLKVLGPGVDVAKVYQAYQEALVKCGSEDCAAQEAIKEATATVCGNVAGVVAEVIVAGCGVEPLAPVAGYLAKEGAEAATKVLLDNPAFMAGMADASRCDDITGICMPEPDSSDSRGDLESQFNQTQAANEEAARQQAAQLQAQQQAQQQAAAGADSGDTSLALLGILQSGVLSTPAPQNPGPLRPSAGPVYNGAPSPSRASTPPPSTPPVVCVQSCECPGPGAQTAK